MKKAPYNPFNDDWNPIEHAAELERFADKLAVSSGVSEGGRPQGGIATQLPLIQALTSKPACGRWCLTPD